MNNIQIFKNEQFGEIRTTELNGEPVFAAIDVATLLGYKEPKQAVVMHCKSGELVYCTHANGIGGTNIKFIKESDVYRLIMKSELPSAERFQDWVCEEILPSIRKHGAYMTEETIEKALTSPDFLIQLATNLKEEQQKRIIAEKQIKEEAPKVLFATAVETSQKSCLIGELAKIIRQNDINMGEKRLFAWLRQNGYLCTHGERYNQPTQKAMDQGLFELKKTTITKPSGEVLVSTTPKVTGKGQIYFVNKFLEKGILQY